MRRHFLYLACFFGQSLGTTFLERRLSACGTGSGSSPNDFTSRSSMEAAGWTSVNDADLLTHFTSDPGFCSEAPANTFCGYSTSALFELRLVLQGAGVLHLDLSTLYANTFRETKVYLNGNWQGETDEGERKVLDITFNNGDQLDIRQAHSSVVMLVYSITFSSCQETTTTTTTAVTTTTTTVTTASVTTTTASMTSSITESSTTSTTESRTITSTTTSQSSTSFTLTLTATSHSQTFSSTTTGTSTTRSVSTTSTTSSSSSTSDTFTAFTSTSTVSITTTSSTSSTSSRSETTLATSSLSVSATFTSTAETSTAETSKTSTAETSTAETSTRNSTSTSTRTTTTLSTTLMSSTSTTANTTAQAEFTLALSNAESSAVQDFLAQLDISNLPQGDGLGLLASQATENDFGEILVAVVSGRSTVQVTTSSGGSVRVDAAVLQQLGGQPVVLSFTSFSSSWPSNASDGPDTGSTGPVVSISLWSLDNSPIRLTDAIVPLQIRIPTNNTEAECIFWNETLEEWSSIGLRLVGYEDGNLICESTHLTIFSTLFQQLITALRCSTAPALLSAEGLSAFGRFPSWLGHTATLVVVLSLFFFALCMASAVGTDRLSENESKEDLVFLVKSRAETSRCCKPVLKAFAVLGMEDSLRDVLALQDRKTAYEAFVSRCIRLLQSHKAGACWDSLRIVMIESSASRALMKSQSLMRRTKRRLNKAFSMVFNRSQKVQPIAEHEEWHEHGGVRIVEGFLSGSWSSRVWSLAPAVHPWLRAVQSSLFSSHSSRMMLMYLKLSTAGAVNALFFQGSALSSQNDTEQCREPDTPFLRAMRAFAIGVLSALVGDFLILILWKVQKRPSTLHEPWSEEAEEHVMRRWRHRLYGFWCVSLVHGFFCIFYIFAFFANVTAEDSTKWLEATLVSLLEDLLLLPVTLALTFGSMATMLLFFRPDVKADIRARWIDDAGPDVKADIRARWIDDAGNISETVLFKPTKKSLYTMEEGDDVAANDPPSSENIRVESMGPAQGSQGPFFGVSPSSSRNGRNGYGAGEAKAVVHRELLD